MSTPAASAQRRSSWSFPVSAGALTATPGRLMPLWSEIRPPTTTRVRTRVPAMPVTSTWTLPSSIRMRSPARNVVDQALVGGGRLVPVAGNIVGGDRELVAGGQLHGAAGELAEADLRPLQVGQHADAPAYRVASGPHEPVGVQVIGVAAVAQVQPCHVETRGDQGVDPLLG